MDVHALRRDGVAPAAAVIARPFNDDPLTVYLYPSEVERSRFAPLMFEALVWYDCLFGHVDYVDGFSAVATWMPETPERLAAAGFGEPPAVIPLDRWPWCRRYAVVRGFPSVRFGRVRQCSGSSPTTGPRGTRWNRCRANRLW